MQLLRHDARNPQARTGVAPAVTRTIIDAHAGEPGDRGLDQMPVEIRSFEAVLEHNRGSAGAATLDVQPIAADIDPSAGRAVELTLASNRLALVPYTHECHEQNQRDFRTEDVAKQAREHSTGVAMCGHACDHRGEEH